jgi:hypothetical protein
MGEFGEEAERIVQRLRRLTVGTGMTVGATIGCHGLTTLSCRQALQQRGDIREHALARRPEGLGEIVHDSLEARLAGAALDHSRGAHSAARASGVIDGAAAGYSRGRLPVRPELRGFPHLFQVVSVSLHRKWRRKKEDLTPPARRRRQEIEAAHVRSVTGFAPG